MLKDGVYISTVASRWDKSNARFYEACIEIEKIFSSSKTNFQRTLQLARSAGRKGMEEKLKGISSYNYRQWPSTLSERSARMQVV